MHEINSENINNLLADGYEVDDDKLPAPEEKPSARCDTYLSVYK